MATPATTAAALAQNRHQGSLREFVNQKLAPYVKKALKDVCDVDAEYPLQWIGEHLINQSFLYENNPDTSGIKERFVYNFDEPEPQQQPASNRVANGNGNPNTVAPANPSQQLSASLQHTVPHDSTAQQLANGDHAASIHLNNAHGAYGAGEQEQEREQMDVERAHHDNSNNSDSHAGLLNGVMDAAAHEQSTATAGQVNGEGAGDTEMADTA